MVIYISNKSLEQEEIFENFSPIELNEENQEREIFKKFDCIC